jgi:hypothetical protein
LPELPEVAAMLSRLAPESKGRSFVGLEALRREVTKTGVQIKIGGSVREVLQKPLRRMVMVCG